MSIVNENVKDKYIEVIERRVKLMKNYIKKYEEYRKVCKNETD